MRKGRNISILQVAQRLPPHYIPPFFQETRHSGCSDNLLWSSVRLANSKARIKPTAPLLAFDKKNLIEFPLDSVYYLYMKSNPNPFFYPMLPYKSLSSRASINEKNKIK